MRKVMILTGLPATLIAAMQTGQIPATKLLGIRKSEGLDGNYDAIYVDRDVKLQDKIEIDVPSGTYGANHALALKDADGRIQGHLLIENDAMSTEDANAIAEIIVKGAYDEATGNVRDAHDGSILMPANVEKDRARIRLVDGTFIEINLANQLGGGDIKLTASVLPVTGNKPAMLVIGAEGDEAVFAKPVDQLILEARNGKVDNIGDEISLDSPLKRITRAKDDQVTIQTDQGAIKAKVEDGTVKFGEKVEAKAPMADDVDTLDTLGTWDNLGETDAVVDDVGNRSQAWAKPNLSGGVTLTFVPTNKAVAKAPEVQV